MAFSGELAAGTTATGCVRFPVDDVGDDAANLPGRVDEEATKDSPADDAWICGDDFVLLAGVVKDANCASGVSVLGDAAFAPW